jgi:hypothetical protein
MCLFVMLNTTPYHKATFITRYFCFVVPDLHIKKLIYDEFYRQQSASNIFSCSGLYKKYHLQSVCIG